MATSTRKRYLISGNGASGTYAAETIRKTDFDGEISVTRCQIPGVGDCAPPCAKNVNALVVSPRNSDGSPTTSTTRKRFYVQVTE